MSSTRHHIHSAAERAVRTDLDEPTLDLIESLVTADLDFLSKRPRSARSNPTTAVSDAAGSA